MKKITTSLLLISTITTITFSQSYIDTSFGINGVSNIKVLDYIEQDLPSGFCVTNSEKLVNVAIGNNDSDESVSIIAQYDTNGNLDPNFGNNGTLELTDFLGIDVISQNEYICVTGISNTNAELTILKLDSFGNADSGFGNNGKASLGILGTFGYSTKIDSNGKLVVAGKHISTTTEENQLIITRFNNNGTLDTTFGTNGITQIDLGHAVTNEEIQVINLELYNNNEILVTGTVYLPDNDMPAGDPKSNEFALKASSNGVLDSDFGNNGFTIYYDLTPNHALTNTSYILPNEKIFMSVDGVGGVNNSQTGLLRLNGDGSIDTSFGNNGILKLFNHSFYIYDFFDSQTDNNIYVLGEGNNNEIFHALIKINENGISDVSFADNGTLIIDIELDNVENLNSGIELSDGKILVSGHNENEDGFVMTRFFKENQLNISDTALKTVALYPNPVRNEINIKSTQAINQLQIYQIDGKLVYNQYLNTNLADVSLLKAGLYIVKAFSENKVETFKINKL
ncbi:T9SS type A sorting domain-containing protein [Algibacter sp. AS12]|uniref:T9SS type A sorting domain-containing protein n=1 Tax=Algibacter sp. AS12 TaxID=3135773 RepID=UPI00398B3BA3